MFNRVAVVVRAIAKFWNLEPGTWNQHLGCRAKPAPGLYHGPTAREKSFTALPARGEGSEGSDANRLMFFEDGP
jgi:hypothetical protein